MRLERFELEHFIAKHETTARYLLGTSGVASVPASMLPDVSIDFDYGEVPGVPALLQAVSNLTGRPEDEILPTVGGTEANLLTFIAALEPGKRVLVESPTYFQLAEVPRLLGAKVERFTRSFDQKFAVDVPALIDRLGPDVCAIVLSNPNNPTGQIVPPRELARLAQAAAAHGAVLIVDEIFRELALDDAPRARILAPNIVTTESLTKCYGLSGLRVGWILGPPELVRRAREAKALTTITNPKREQLIAAHALARRDAILARARAIVNENLPMLRDFLDAAGWEYVPTRAPPLCAPKLPSGVDDVKFCERLVAQESVLLVPGSYVDLPGHVRLCVGEEPAKFREGLQRLAKFAI